jgi:hypothetical protein
LFLVCLDNKTTDVDWVDRISSVEESGLQAEDVSINIASLAYGKDHGLVLIDGMKITRESRNIEFAQDSRVLGIL